MSNFHGLECDRCRRRVEAERCVDDDGDVWFDNPRWIRITPACGAELDACSVACAKMLLDEHQDHDVVARTSERPS